VLLLTECLLLLFRYRLSPETFGYTLLNDFLSSRVLLGYNAVQCYGRGPMLPPLQGDVDILPQHYTASQPSRTRLEIITVM